MSSRPHLPLTRDGPEVSRKASLVKLVFTLLSSKLSVAVTKGALFMDD